MKSDVTAVAEDDGASTVTITYAASDSSIRGSYQVKVREAPERMLTFPSSCGKEDEPQPQYVVEGVEKLQ